MESFHWDTSYLTGLPDVDHQHEHLVNVINQYGDLLAEDKVVFNDIDTIFKELGNYAQYHFQEEEELMALAGIDKRHLEYHVEIHKNFLNEITAMHADISINNIDSAKHLLAFLTHWLAYHILGSDQNMARQIKAIQSGISPSDAYDIEEKQSNSATEPLLVALNGLFEQLSLRNKQLVKLNQSLEEKVAMRTKELSESNLRLETLSLTDVLTGLPNRRHAINCLSPLWTDSTQNNLPLVCIMIDADHFKEVNDNYGHDAGDVVLSTLAKTLKDSFRNDDIVCRLGGDEFFVICPNTDKEGGLYVAELARKTVSELRVQAGKGVWHGSISVGVASKSVNIKNYEDLIKAADQGVYAAKKDGKNCVRSIG